jgi:4a-hydroxytetrahydrobiopterin dehydratase
MSSKNCTPCLEGSDPVSLEYAQSRLENLKGWYLFSNNTKIKKDYQFKDFLETLDFVNKVSKVAEEQGHHPDIYFTYGKCSIEIFTHKIDNLHENDFILASKIEEI